MNKYLRDIHQAGTYSFISGAARSGADRLIIDAVRNSRKELGLVCHEYPADWDKGKGAGFARNNEMAKVATHLICFWDGVSRGSLDMIKRALANGLIVHVYRYDKASGLLAEPVETLEDLTNEW